MNVITLQELIDLGPGTLFIPMNVGGPAQMPVQVLTMISARRIEFSSAFPKMQYVEGGVAPYHHSSDIRLIASNYQYYRFVHIKDLEQYLEILKANLEDLISR